MTPSEPIRKEFEDAALIARLSSGPSAVAGRESPFGFLTGVAGVCALGLVVYLSLSAGRHARAQGITPQPPRVMRLAQATPAPAPVVMPVQAQIAQPSVQPDPAAAQAAADAQARLRAPSMVVDLSEPAEPAVLSAAPGQAVGPSRDGGARLGSDERFAQRVASAQVDTARATRLANPALVAPQGTIISAVMETGIISDVPGFARAVVSRDVSGFDGTTVVIPRGSKLIGEYKSGVAQGQSRAFVIWSRLLTPDGVSINLGSPAGDRLGRGGLEGKVNTHFFQRFGGAILLSVIDGGVQALANQAGGSGGVNALVIGSPQQAANVATVALQKDIDIPTTVTIAQGQAIRVFVARDLDFSDVIQGR